MNPYSFHRWPLLLGAILAAVPAQAADLRVRAAVDAREGPGAYYPVVMRLLPGASVNRLEVREGWNLTGLKQQKGWVPERALEAAKKGSSAAGPTGSLLEQLEQGDDGAGKKFLTAAEVAAAVRGFAQAYVASRGGAGADAGLLEGSAFTADEYAGFSAKRFSDRSRTQCWGAAPLTYTSAPERDPHSDRLGAAVALSIAGTGLLRDAALERYLSQVATLVAESSHAYDLPTRVFVLSDDRPVGYATPNGVLFISIGALRQMHSEAEFAFFAGHEIAHVAFQHGMRRTSADRQRIAEDQVFAEMESDLGWGEREGDRYVELNAELSAMADEIYEYFRSESNDAQELEADRWGLIYMARAGYTPDAAARAIQNLANAQVSEADEKLGSKLFWRGTPVPRRLLAIQSTRAQIRAQPQLLRDFSADYLNAIKTTAGGDNPAGRQ